MLYNTNELCTNPVQIGGDKMTKEVSKRLAMDLVIEMFKTNPTIAPWENTAVQFADFIKKLVEELETV